MSLEDINFLQIEKKRKYTKEFYNHLVREFEFETDLSEYQKIYYIGLMYRNEELYNDFINEKGLNND